MLAAALALLAAMRIAATLIPSMAPWSLNVARFVPVPWAVAALVLPVLALLPPVARPLTAWLDRMRFETPAAIAALTLAAAALVWLLPDRVWLTGDYIGRQFSLNAPGAGLAWYTHSVPLDTAIHQRLGQWAVAQLGVPSIMYGRLLGVVEAGALAWIALGFARALALRGAAALAVAAVLFFGGGLALLTGYNKALSESVLVVAAFAMFGLRAVREGRGIVALAAVFALGLLLHRSMLALAPAFFVAWWMWRRHPGRTDALRRVPAWLPLALPALALAIAAPQLIEILQRFDLPLFFQQPSHAASSGAGLARWFDPLNVLVLFSPAFLVAVPLALVIRRVASRQAEATFMLALLAPMLVLAAAFYPPEGLFRFWDTLAGPGVALSVATGWLAALAMNAPRGRRLALALALAAACPSVAWLVHSADAERGIERARAYVAGPPAPGPEVSANVREYLGFRLMDLGRYSDAAEAFKRAAEMVPSPRVLQQWETAALEAGDLAGATASLRITVERDPENAASWRRLATVAMRRGESAEAARALEAIVRLDPADTTARRLLGGLSSGARAAGP